MKYSLLIIAFIGLSLPSFAQKLDSVLRIGTRKVILQNNNTADQNYEAIISILKRNHIEIDSVYKKDRVVKTTPYKLKENAPYLVSETIHWSDKEVQLESSSIKEKGRQKNTYSPIEFSTFSGTKKVFTNMSNFCELIGGNIYYETRFKNFENPHF